MTRLSIDFETRSTVELKTAGVYVYAEHPTTDIWCMAWAFDDEEPQIWTPETRTFYPPGFPSSPSGLPARVLAHIRADGEVRAWNAQFERIIWREIMVKRYGAPPIRDAQFVCTAAEAAAMALPRALGHCAFVLKITQQKDTEGHDLMLRMCRPRRVLDDGTPVWWDNSGGKLDKLFAYCIQDVRTERAHIVPLRRLTPHERALYLLDQRMNDRGVAIDAPLVRAAMAIAAEASQRAEVALGELTGGAVTKVTDHKALAAWVREQGVETSGVSKPAIQELMERDLVPLMREVLQIRVDVGRTSVAKLASMLRCACHDLVVRGLLLYHAASTGRWAGRLVQPQNFPRGEIKDPTRFIPAVLADDYEYLDLFAPPLAIISSLLRSMLVARPGHALIAGDFSAIEARVVNWLAGQADVLEDFAAYDAGDKRRDPYIIMAARMGADVSRQTGKAAELGCGFQMGARKFIDAAWKVYQVRVTKEQARDAVKVYRASHKKVVALWYDAEDACLGAIAEPGKLFTFGAQQIKVIVAGAYLYIILPSGRPLCFAAPRAVEREVIITDEEGEEKRFRKVGMEFNGVDAISKQWGTQRAYGGLLIENVTQAIARDLMADAMLECEAKGFPPILSVHDEVIAEIGLGRDPATELRDFEECLLNAPAWADGCPLAVSSWMGPRYKK